MTISTAVKPFTDNGNENSDCACPVLIKLAVQEHSIAMNTERRNRNGMLCIRALNALNRIKHLEQK